MRLLGIKYQGCAGDPKTLLHGYFNADFTGNRLIQRSISGNVYFFVSKIISCLLKRQQIVTQFTTKAKYYTLAKAVSEALWLRQIVGQMMYSGADIKSVRLYGDSQGSLSLAENLSFINGRSILILNITLFESMLQRE